MIRAFLVSTLAILAVGCQTAPKSAPHAAWSYEGSTGPAHWGDLKPEYALAKTGRSQSPIDIDPSAATRQKGPALSVAYAESSLKILNNGHTIEDEYEGGGTLTVDGHTYALAQFHFHSPSEHTIRGRHAPMEMHLVHKDSAGKLAVIGVMIEEGAEHPELAGLWKHLPTEAGRTEDVPGETVHAQKLLPPSLASFRYSGSLTTPPCTEGVSWFVLETPIQASKQQIEQFRRVIHGNNRPTQPLNGRSVVVCE